MEQAKNILNASLLWRWLMSLCRWCGDQWRASGVVQWFLHPGGWTPAASEHSVFYKLWSLVRGGLCWLYEKLRLDKLFAGSVFTKSWFWCLLPAAAAPVLPTMAVLGLTAIAYCSLALNLVRDRNRRLAWAPTNRYILLYAAIYMAGTLFSVNLRSSLNPGLLTVCFVLFSLVLFNAVDSRNQLDVLLDGVVLVGAAVAAYGILQYMFRWGYQSAAWVDSDMFSSIEFRVPSTLDNPNMLGQYLILMVPVGAAKLLSARDWPRRLLYLGCCALMCVCMILTFSRGAWLGLLFAGAVFVVRLHHLPGVHLAGHPGHAETLLAVRHRAGGRGFQPGLPRLQLQQHQRPPLPQPVFAAGVRRGHHRPGGLPDPDICLLPHDVRRPPPGEGLDQPDVSDRLHRRGVRLPGPGHDRLLLL